MKYFLLLTLALSSLPSWAKIITKAEVAKQFALAVKEHPEDFTCKGETVSVVPGSVEISLAENILWASGDLFRKNLDIYEVHAELKIGKKIYAYNSDLTVWYHGVETVDGARVHSYAMSSIGDVSYYRISTGESRICTDGNLVIHSWPVKKKYY